MKIVAKSNTMHMKISAKINTMENVNMLLFVHSMSFASLNLWSLKM